jgi:hypothetical protein
MKPESVPHTGEPDRSPVCSGGSRTIDRPTPTIREAVEAIDSALETGPKAGPIDVPGLITGAQAGAIVGQLFRWLVDEPITNPERQRSQLSLVAAIVCDATSAEITVQPLHVAYVRAKTERNL